MARSKETSYSQILTAEQKAFLDLVSQEKYLCERFYFTGGTALAEFYLQHRPSEDLDLFSEKEIYLPSVRAFVKKSANYKGIRYHVEASSIFPSRIEKSTNSIPSSSSSIVRSSVSKKH